jgi:uridine kinase
MTIIKIKDFLKNSLNYTNGSKLISVSGGSGSGKSYFSNDLSKIINAKVIKLDDYIIPQKITKKSNWDLPECWDLDMIRENLEKYLKGKSFRKPIYNFKRGTNHKSENIFPGKPLILDGLYSLYDPIVDLADYKIFVDVDEKERLNRVLKRDIIERGNKTEEKILKRWNETIQPTYLEFVEPQKYKADIVLA